MHPNGSVLNDYVDDALGTRERAEVDAHLASCATCRSLVDELRDIARTAASLEEREPPARTWARIERAIELERDGVGRGWVARGFQPSGHDMFGLARLKGSRYTWLSAAAALLIATVVGFWYIPSRTTPSSRARTGSGAEVTSQSVEAEL